MISVYTTISLPNGGLFPSFKSEQVTNWQQVTGDLSRSSISNHSRTNVLPLQNIMPSNDTLSDDYIASLLAKDAKDRTIKYSSLGLGALLPKRSAPATPRPKSRPNSLQTHDQRPKAEHPISEEHYQRDG